MFRRKTCICLVFFMKKNPVAQPDLNPKKGIPLYSSAVLMFHVVVVLKVLHRITHFGLSGQNFFSYSS